MKGVALEWELHEFNPTIMPLFFACFFKRICMWQSMIKLNYMTFFVEFNERLIMAG